ncbi:MAG: Mrp/NBP35 family ATP-binding protein [Erysipelotrichaceae bacterium]|nr:Mrp/NBP35 family ATP-binding protein [Erysipelotrichaceae bacterium]
MSEKKSSSKCDTCQVAGCGARTNTPPQKKVPQLSTRINKIIGVLSGKGGVGKSFVSSVLAVELARKGFRVGIMDADITGPSIPRIFSIHGYAYGDDKGMYPVRSERYGIKVMSVNLLLDEEETPVLWRGPIVSGVVDQFYTDTYWEELDYLIIDIPPGTGDVALSVMQDIPLDGLLIVSNPSKLVSMIVAKAINMAKKTDTKIIGLVENMSYVACPNCGEKIELYPKNNTQEMADKYDVPILARMPLDPSLSALVEEGRIEDYDASYMEEVIKRVTVSNVTDC